MSLREQIEALEELIDFVETKLPIYAEKVAASDLAALVADRVINNGENFRGGSFKPYSTNQMAAFRFWGKSRNQSAEKEVRKRSKARGTLSYTEFRELNKLNTVKNFEFTGEMWKKFGVISFSFSGDLIKIKIGGQTPIAQTKIDENSKREGISIIEASPAEVAIIARTSAAWFEEQANIILNG